MQHTFFKIYESIPLEFRLTAAYEYSRMFDPTLEYSYTDAIFISIYDQSKFAAYVIGKWKAKNETVAIQEGIRLEGRILVKWRSHTEPNKLQTSQFMDAVAIKLPGKPGIGREVGLVPLSTLIGISEPSDSKSQTCDSYTKLSERVKFLEDAVMHLTNDPVPGWL